MLPQPNLARYLAEQRLDHLRAEAAARRQSQDQFVVPGRPWLLMRSRRSAFARYHREIARCAAQLDQLD